MRVDLWSVGPALLSAYSEAFESLPSIMEIRIRFITGNLLMQPSRPAVSPKFSVLN